MSTEKMLLTKIHNNWTEREISVLRDAIEESGVRPISPTLSKKMYNLFLEGYTCEEIASLNPPFQEKDVLYVRYKHDWDVKKEEYAKNLADRVQQKLLKQKLESVEFLTDVISSIHKGHKEAILKFLQSENPEDFPKLPSIKLYKDLLEALAKVTGEDKKVKVEGKLQHETTFNFSNIFQEPLKEDMHTKLLKLLADNKSKDK